MSHIHSLNLTDRNLAEVRVERADAVEVCADPQAVRPADQTLSCL